ncbi:matrixin family metalloprotease [Botrimarina hoheduenensis]|uniref:Matrixin n=1 Tax=Botrimarina hoheduenensis TaxID=2528000 RepID=A0A5C5VZ91_9BACT|nr:matrixin family metalloprotease [Botrimarina hoheduenensis]TWT43407.1 Matrixin [Botrimarina hoheduenensis]
MSRILALFASLVVWVALAEHAQACSFCAAMGCTPCDRAPVAATDDPNPGYVLQGDGVQWPQPGGDGTPITITYSYNNFLDGGMLDPSNQPIAADFIRQVTAEAFGLWAAVAPLHFVEVPDAGGRVFVGFSAAYNALPQDGFGQIRISHRFINGTDEQNGMPVAKALAWFPAPSAGAIGGDIHFDNGDRWGIVGTPSQPDILGILTHEIGHALGLAHSTTSEAAMWFAAPRRSGPGTGMLWPADIAGVRAIYGAGIGSVTPLQLVPEPTAALLVVVAAFGVACTGRR